MEKIYKRQKWLRVTQENIENLKPLYLLKKLNSQLNLLTRKLVSPDDATGEVYQIGKEEIIPTLHKVLHKIEERTLPTLFFEASIIL